MIDKNDILGRLGIWTPSCLPCTLHCMKVKGLVSQLQPTRFVCPWNSSGDSTGVGSQPLLQRNFLTQNWAQVSHIAGRFFTFCENIEACNRLPKFSNVLFILLLCLDNYIITSWNFIDVLICLDFPGGSDSKASAYNAGDPGSIPGLGRSSGKGNGNPLQHSCLENPMDGGAWVRHDWVTSLLHFNMFKYFILMDNINVLLYIWLWPRQCHSLNNLSALHHLVYYIICTICATLW